MIEGANEAEADVVEKYYRIVVREHGERYQSFHWPSLEAIFNLAYTYNLVANELADLLSPYKLSPSAFNVLMILKRSGSDGLPLTRLSGLLVVSRASVTGLIDCLEDRRLVERTVDPSDRRLRVAKLTDEGRMLLENLLPSYYPAIRALGASLDDEEKRTLCELLTRLRRGLRPAATKSEDPA